MLTDVVMPQMGESIFEGTITKWLKKPGEKVQRDELLFEISTDKVDAEIPAPATGVLKEIKMKEGATVPVNTVVAVIDTEGAAVPATPSAQQQSAAPVKPAPQADGAPARQQPPATEAAPPVQSAGASGNGGSGGAATDVVMPQMGESIFEGTITKWLKKPGDKVQRDELLFEISTDKVDAEIPAPTTGILREIRVKEGSTVQVNTVVAVISGAGAAAPAPAPSKPAAPTPAARQQEPQPVAVTQPREQVIGFPPRGETEHVRSSPLVRRIARENNVNLGQVSGTGLGGRISKNDILGFIQQHGPGATATVEVRQAPPTAPPQTVPVQPPVQQQRTAAQPTVSYPELAGELVPMSAMRKKIAERMVESKRTSAHVHSIFKVDMTRVVRLREKLRKPWEARHGVKLTYMPFIAKALMHGVRVKPVVNASVAGDSLQYHKNVNIGIAVALEWGLIVPVVKGAENLSFVGLQRAISDLGERARNKKLLPDEVQGGTITITNPGIYGPQFGTPIILQPQVAILGMGGIFKEPVVITDADGNDSIAVRHIIRLVLGYDHRIVDGADADQFLVAVRDYLENFEEDIG